MPSVCLVMLKGHLDSASTVRPTSECSTSAETEAHELVKKERWSEAQINRRPRK